MVENRWQGCESWLIESLFKPAHKHSQGITEHKIIKMFQISTFSTESYIATCKTES